jgi:gluconokinase
MSTAASQQPFEPMTYVIMGVSGCGKSVVGEALAAHLGATFVEGDSLHPTINIDKMAQGIPLTDGDRLPWLDRIGAAIAKNSDKGLVVSCSSLKKIYRDRLRGFAGGRLTFIYLRGTEALLSERMAARRGHFMPPSLLKSQLATLEEPVDEDDAIMVDIAGSQQHVIEKALEAIDRHTGQGRQDGIGTR